MLVAKEPVLFEQNLVMTVEPVQIGETAERYLARHEDQLLKANVQRTAVGRSESVTLESGRKALLAEYKLGGGPTGERLRQLQLVTIKDDVAYVLIATHLDGPVFEASREQMRSFLLSFA
jgi:hypothetical protein